MIPSAIMDPYLTAPFIPSLYPFVLIIIYEILPLFHPSFFFFTQLTTHVIRFKHTQPKVFIF